MRRSRFTNEQIFGILKEPEAGIPASGLGRKRGVSDASIYKWKARFGGRAAPVSDIYSSNVTCVGCTTRLTTVNLCSELGSVGRREERCSITRGKVREVLKDSENAVISDISKDGFNLAETDS